VLPVCVNAHWSCAAAVSELPFVKAYAAAGLCCSGHFEHAQATHCSSRLASVDMTVTSTGLGVPIYQSVNHLINQTISQSVNQSINQSITQSINQSINQSISQSSSQPQRNMDRKQLC